MVSLHNARGLFLPSFFFFFFFLSLSYTRKHGRFDCDLLSQQCKNRIQIVDLCSPSLSFSIYRRDGVAHGDENEKGLFSLIGTHGSAARQTTLAKCFLRSLSQHENHERGGMDDGTSSRAEEIRSARQMRCSLRAKISFSNVPQSLSLFSSRPTFPASVIGRGQSPVAVLESRVRSMRTHHSLGLYTRLVSRATC